MLQVCFRLSIIRRAPFLKRGAHGRCTARKKCALRHRHFRVVINTSVLIVTRHYISVPYCHEVRLLPLRARVFDNCPCDERTDVLPLSKIQTASLFAEN